MSDTTERDAVLAKFYARHNGLRTLSAVRAAVKVDMADEIVRLRAENAALTAAVERVRALHHNRMRGAYACAECRDDYPCHTIRALEVGRE